MPSLLNCEYILSQHTISLYATSSSILIMTRNHVHYHGTFTTRTVPHVLLTTFLSTTVNCCSPPHCPPPSPLNFLPLLPLVWCISSCQVLCIMMILNMTTLLCPYGVLLLLSYTLHPHSTKTTSSTTSSASILITTAAGPSCCLLSLVSCVVLYRTLHSTFNCHILQPALKHGHHPLCATVVYSASSTMPSSSVLCAPLPLSASHVHPLHCSTYCCILLLLQ